MNKPTRSKINYTSLLIALVGVASALGHIPPEMEKPLTDLAMIAGPLLIMTFRTWFTGPRE